MNPKTLFAALLGGMVAGGVSCFLMMPRALGLPVTSKAQMRPQLRTASNPLVITSAVPPDAEFLEPMSKPSPFLAKVAPTPAPAPIPVPAPTVKVESLPTIPEAPPLPPPSKIINAPNGPNTVTLIEGTPLYIRLGESLNSKHNLTGDTFHATLDKPLVAGGYVIAEKGARVEGRITDVSPTNISLELTHVNTSDGQHLPVKTPAFSSESFRSGKKIEFTTRSAVTITEYVMQ